MSATYPVVVDHQVRDNEGVTEDRGPVIRRMNGDMCNIPADIRLVWPAGTSRCRRPLTPGNGRSFSEDVGVQNVTLSGGFVGMDGA